MLCVPNDYPVLHWQATAKDWQVALSCLREGDRGREEGPTSSELHAIHEGAFTHISVVTFPGMQAGGHIKALKYFMDTMNSLSNIFQDGLIVLSSLNRALTEN